MSRVTGLAVSLFDIGGGHYINQLTEATLTVEPKTVEGKGIHDLAADPVVVGYSWRIEADVDVAIAADLAAAALGLAPVAIVANSGANTYSGTALVRASHAFGRDQLQKQHVTLFGKGPLAMLPPG